MGTNLNSTELQVSQLYPFVHCISGILVLCDAICHDAKVTFTLSLFLCFVFRFCCRSFHFFVNFHGNQRDLIAHGPSLEYHTYTHKLHILWLEGIEVKRRRRIKKRNEPKQRARNSIEDKCTPWHTKSPQNIHQRKKERK